VDTGLHAFGWSVDQAKDFMRSNTASSEVDIDAEVKRYCTWPGQATGGTLSLSVLYLSIPFIVIFVILCVL
jgi:uncharacterized protein (DUF885 family)